MFRVQRIGDLDAKIKHGFDLQRLTVVPVTTRLPPLTIPCLADY
jgi:hypothetical protein